MSSNIMHITTSRLILRPFSPSDGADITRLGMENLKSSFLPDWVVPEPEAFAHFLGERMERPDPHTGPVVWAVTLKESGEMIGHVGVGPKEELGGEVELGYAVSMRFAGLGLATEAAKAAVWWAFERGGLEYIAALVLPENTASRRVLDKVGFIPAGTRRLDEDGLVRFFDYFRFYHLDWYETPDWKPDRAGEPMGAFFDRRVDGYEAHMMDGLYTESSYAEAVVPVAETDEAIEVLDLGCGTGLELKWLFRRAPNARVTCVDLSAGMLEMLKSNYTDRLGQITIIQASYIDWTYPADSFDYVLSVNTMHHFLEPAKVGIYRKVLQALKPGGRYIESDFMVDDIMMEQYRRRCRRILDAAGLSDAATGTIHADLPFTPALQKELLYNAGFSEVFSYKESIQPKHSRAILISEK